MKKNSGRAIHRSCRRSGMTLIELMVSAALSAILLVALMGVLRGMTTQVRLADRINQPVWPSRFVKLLQRDLLAADAVWEQSGTVWIQTDAPLYPVGQSVNESSGSRTVGYRCTTFPGDRNVLERIDSERIYVLAFGPTRMVVERLDSHGQPQPLPPSQGPVPGQVRVWVWNDVTERAVILKDLVIR